MTWSPNTRITLLAFTIHHSFGFLFGCSILLSLDRTCGNRRCFRRSMYIHMIQYSFIYRNLKNHLRIQLKSHIEAASTHVSQPLINNQIAQNYFERSIFLTASLTFNTKDGDTDNSSIPIRRNVSVRVVSAPSSPQMPIQAPCLWALSAAIFIRRRMAS